MLLWDQFLSQLEGELGHETVAKWLRPLKIIRFDAANLYLEAEDSFQISFFEEHVRPLTKTFTNPNQRPIKIHLSCANPLSKLPSQEAKSPPFHIAPDSLDPEMTLSHFIRQSPSHAVACDLILELEKSSFNPMFFYGPKGCGKTHLLMAAAHLLQTKKTKVFYTSAAHFTEHVVQAIRKGYLPELRSVYRSIDALLIDDVEIFSKKTATQEEFFHTFNDLHIKGIPILLSSSIAPGKLSEIEPRLISRFEWGISIPLQKGDWTPILQQKAKNWKLSLHPNLIPFLIEKFPSSPLLALQTLALRAKTQIPFDPSLATSLLKDLLEKESIQAITAEEIIKKVAAHFGALSSDILGKTQARDIALQRQIAMYLCRKQLNLPFQKIGEIFGRDHSTVMTSVRHIQKRIDAKDPDLSNIANSIAKALKE